MSESAKNPTNCLNGRTMRTTVSTQADRVRERLTALDMNPFEAARRANLDRGYLSDLLSGKKRSVRGSALIALAETLDCDVGYLVGAQDFPRSFVRANYGNGKSHALPFGGTVEAGAFREIDPTDQSEHDPVDLPPDPEFPENTQTVYAVAGDSMNAAGIEPGMFVAAVSSDAYVAAHGALRDGQIVVVERLRNDGQERELTVKRLRIYEDRTELVPASTNPRHKPIVIPRNHAADDGTQVRVTGVVRMATRLFR